MLETDARYPIRDNGCRKLGFSFLTLTQRPSFCSRYHFHLNLFCDAIVEMSIPHAPRGLVDEGATETEGMKGDISLFLL
jgi:hypothetical protein